MAAAVLFACFLSGCATPAPVAEKTPEIRRRAKLVRTQSGDQVTLQWASEIGTSYSVIYTRSLDSKRAWKPLEQFTGIQGNGSTMSVTFKAPEPGTLYYRMTDSPSTGR